MFKKILIANRGEIACRIARTAKQMGIQSVAVYSQADQNSLHVKACDEAVYIGQSEPQKSYLEAEKVIAAARQTGAQAIHPGYGFLSENADFAAQCARQNIIFIGPTPEAIAAMGSKSSARQIMQEASIPVVPGYDEADQKEATLIAQAAKIGFPILIKAVAGGGGKGLRVVKKEADFKQALEAVKRESMGAFADDAVILEKYLLDTRHIEVQIFADSHGGVVHLFERDCSLQRRHQKVLEEAPASGLSDTLRDEMTQAAINCSKAINYLGAGTVEFLLAPDETFYFMEMNTRLQVEHPVTEMITGQDLVAWQFQVAAGEPLPLKQSEISLQGHAIEVRVYAENPQQGFLPSTGRLEFLRAPQSTDYVRVDTGVAQGDSISPYYDPMIAKLICWGSDRAQALARLGGALMQYQLVGTRHNLNFLADLCAHPIVQSGGANTRFIDAHLAELIPAEQTLNENALLSAAVFFVQQQSQRMIEIQLSNNDPWSPWAESEGWRVGQHAFQDLCLQFNDAPLDLQVQRTQTGWTIKTSARTIEVDSLQSQLPQLKLSIAGAISKAITIGAENSVDVLLDNHTFHFDLIIADGASDELLDKGGQNASPMPGKIITCHVAKRDTVSEGDVLMVVEAMKMEHSIVAASGGVVLAVNFKVGDQVEEGDILLAFEQ